MHETVPLLVSWKLVTADTTEVVGGEKRIVPMLTKRMVEGAQRTRIAISAEDFRAGEREVTIFVRCGGDGELEEVHPASGNAKAVRLATAQLADSIPARLTLRSRKPIIPVIRRTAESEVLSVRRAPN